MAVQDLRVRNLPCEAFHEHRNLDSNVWKFNINESCRVRRNCAIITRIAQIVSYRAKHLEGTEYDEEGRAECKACEDRNYCQVGNT